MAYTALEDVETGNVLGASLWNHHARHCGVADSNRAGQGRSDNGHRRQRSGPSAVFPASPTGQLLGSQGASVGYLSTLTGDRSGDYTPATPEGSASNDSRVTTFGSLRRTLVGN